MSSYRYFVAKCSNYDSLRRGVDSNVWAAPEHKNDPQPHLVLSTAFSTCSQVNILFSVNGSKGWQGHAVMKSLPFAADELKDDGECWHRFEIEWVCLSKHYAMVCLPFSQTEDLLNSLDFNNSVNKARNWQEMPSSCGEQLCARLQTHIQQDAQKRERDALKAKEQRPPPFLSIAESDMQDTGRVWQSMNDKVEQYGKVVLACAFGSQRYNLQTLNSDLDMYVVYMADTRNLLSFNSPPRTIKNREDEKPDFTIHELFKYCELLVAGDPRTVETLFLRDTCIYYASDTWKELKQSRDLLLSRVLVDKYLSDALGERGLKKMQKWQAKEIKDDIQVATGQKYEVFYSQESSEHQMLQAVRSGHIPHEQLKDIIKTLTFEVQSALNSDECHLPKTSDETHVEKWLVKQRRDNLLSDPYFVTIT
ncbi:uncharacterized protein LOC134179897 isoform X2 [Corticium candelabrum]|uniref:uncharacterized protein LOC134179897 isoform X2 n=1 Tax=Corticium candelabrum TaxID=121492 RepID=UPI002E262CEF|nr:uncharacterized protein LOC134179897 isoform X2 [Corticium candelabrum]